MTTLRVIVDDIVAVPNGGAADYALHLTRALIRTAPRGAQVEGVVSASPEPDYEFLLEALPGLAGLSKSYLARRELRAAWRAGSLGMPGSGMVHAPSLMAPFARHDRRSRPDHQLVATIHDALAWTDRDALSSGFAGWTLAMAKRAERHADALIVPNHAVADALSAQLDVAQRIRVIPGAPRLWPTRAEPLDLELPPRSILTVARPGLRDELALFAERLEARGVGVMLHVMVPAGARAPEQLPASVRLWSEPSSAEQRALLAGVVAYADPVRADAGAEWALEALAAGTPVVHLDLPGISDLTSGASIAIPADSADPIDGLIDGVVAVLENPELAERLRITGRDRARAFNWDDTADRIWQLHAEL